MMNKMITNEEKITIIKLTKRKKHRENVINS